MISREGFVTFERRFRGKERVWLERSFDLEEGDVACRLNHGDHHVLLLVLRQRPQLLDLCHRWRRIAGPLFSPRQSLGQDERSGRKGEEEEINSREDGHQKVGICIDLVALERRRGFEDEEQPTPPLQKRGRGRGRGR